MDTTSYADLHGVKIKLDQTSGPFRRCAFGQECEASAQVGVIRPGIGPHVASLRCFTCGRHLSWVGKAQLDALRGQIKARETS